MAGGGGFLIIECGIERMADLFFWSEYSRLINKSRDSLDVLSMCIYLHDY